MKSASNTERGSLLLPRICTKASSNSKTCSTVLTERLHPQSQLKRYLRQIKNEIDKISESQIEKEQHKLIYMSNINKLYQHAKRIQKKKSSEMEVQSLTIQNQPEEHEIYVSEEEQLHKVVVVRNIWTKWKPPHRYKTSMLLYQSNIILYGGLGCEKEITWAKLSLSPLKWSVPQPITVPHSKNQFTPILPIYGHTMAAYKSFAFIYGGVCCDSVMNDLIILNMKSMSMQPGTRADFRRKEHSMTMINKFMVVHGGLENGQQVKNNLFYYDVETEKWASVYAVSGKELPYLSHHGIVTSYNQNKSKRKLNHFSQLSNESLYVFGGKDISTEATNKLYKFKITAEGEISVEQLIYPNAPEPRYSHSFHFIETGYLMVYGGKRNQQFESPNMRRGIYNDICLFSLEKKQWISPEINSYAPVPYRFGMASVANRGKVYVFGGCQEKGYANGQVLLMKVVQGGTAIVTGNNLEQETSNLKISRNW